MIIYLLIIIKRFFRRFRFFLNDIYDQLVILYKKNLDSYKKTKMLFMVLKTKSIISDLSENTDAEVLSLVSHKDIPLYLVAIKSFYFYLSRKIMISVIDDGTLRDEDKLLLKNYIKGVRIVDKTTCDHLIKREFEGEDLILEYREKDPRVRKVIDLPLLALKEKLIFLDSDVLFFREPEEIINWIDNRKVHSCFFMRDELDANMISNVEAMYFFHRVLIPKFNVGLLGFYKEFWDKKLIIDFFKVVLELSIWRPLFVDQTIFNLMFSGMKQRIFPLPHSYYLSISGKNKNKLVCRHYVNFKSVRDLFWRQGIKVIEKINQIEKNKAGYKGMP